MLSPLSTACAFRAAFYNTTVSLCDSCTCGCLHEDALISDGGSCDPHASASDTTAAQSLIGTNFQNKTVVGLGSGVSRRKPRTK